MAQPTTSVKGLRQYNYLGHWSISPNTYQSKGIRVRSTTDVSLTLTLNNYYYGIFESMLLLPTVVLSTEYVLPYGKDMMVLIVGMENNTEFKIQYSTVNGSAGVIEQYQTYLLHNTTTSDPVSCSVSSTKPIAVFMSTKAQNHHQDFASLEQAIPVSSWGKQYIVPKLTVDHSFRILVSQNGTHIHTDEQ